MKNVSRITTATAFFAGLFSLLGCVTEPPVPVISEPIVHKTADLTMTLRHLGQDELIEKHGKNGLWGYENPFYGYPALITKQRLICFEFQATTTESTVLYSLDDIYLSIGKVTGKAKSRQYLENIWSHYEDVDMREMQRTLKKTMLEKKFEVSPGQAVSGYLVFGEDYREEGGDGVISFSLSTPNGERGEIEIPLEFSSGGVADGSGSDTGIFADN